MNVKQKQPINDDFFIVCIQNQLPPSVQAKDILQDSLWMRWETHVDVRLQTETSH